MEMQYLNIDNTRLYTVLPENFTLRLEAHIELSSSWLVPVGWFVIEAGKWREGLDSPWYGTHKVPIQKSKP